MKCEFCGNLDITEWDKGIVDHLIITKDPQGLYHVHGCIEDKEEVKRMMGAIKKEMGPLRRVIPGQIITKEKENISSKNRALLIVD